MKKEIESVKPNVAKQLVDSGSWVLVDVRTVDLYKKSHPQGAVSAPLFQAVDWSNIDARVFLRSIAYMFNGVSPVEANPNFDALVQEGGNGKGVIMMCEAGGTLVPTPNFPSGKTSRSLMACYRALTNGSASKVAHLDGGVYGWYQANLPFDGEYDTSNVGRTPNAAEAPSLDDLAIKK